MWGKRKSFSSVLSDSLQPHGLYRPWNSPGQNAEMVSLSFPSPVDLPNPGIESRSPALQWMLYQLSHQESPRILEWVAYPFSSGSSRPSYQTRVSCIAGGFFYQLSYQGSPLQWLLLLWSTGSRARGIQ